MMTHDPSFVLPLLQRRREYDRQQPKEVSDLLLDNRIVYIPGVIDEWVNTVVMQLLYLQYQNRSQGISLYLNSHGGSVASTLAIYDTMQFVDCPVATYCIGMAASGAAVLLAGGTKGRRYSLPHSKIMIHQPYGQVSGQISDIKIQVDEYKRNKHLINEIIAKHSGKTIEEVALKTERDQYLTAHEALEFGLVDEVVGKVSNTEDGKR